MADLQALAAELTNDPLARGYSGKNDAEAAADGHTLYRTRQRTSMTGSEVLNAVDAGEWAALTDAQQQTVWDITHLGTVDPYGIEATLMIGVFGAGSQTITNLAAIRQVTITRWDELSLGKVSSGHVEAARL